MRPNTQEDTIELIEKYINFKSKFPRLNYNFDIVNKK